MSYQIKRGLGEFPYGIMAYQGDWDTGVMIYHEIVRYAGCERDSVGVYVVAGDQAPRFVQAPNPHGDDAIEVGEEWLDTDVNIRRLLITAALSQ